MNHGFAVEGSLLLGLQGNIVLTDRSYKVLTLLRVYKDDEAGAATTAGLPYPVHRIRLYKPATREGLQQALDAASDKVALKRAQPTFHRQHCTAILQAAACTWLQA